MTDLTLGNDDDDLKRLQKALFGDEKDYMPMVEAFQGTEKKSSFMQTLLPTIAKLRESDKSDRASVIKTFSGSTNKQVTELLGCFLSGTTPSKHSLEENPVRLEVINTLATLDDENAQKLLQKLAVNPDEKPDTRKNALQALKTKNKQLYHEAVEAIFDQIAKGDSQEVEDRNVAYAAPNVFVDNDEGLTDRLIDAFKNHHAPSTLVKVLAHSKAPEAHRALFEIGLIHEDYSIRGYSAEAISEYSKNNHGLMDKEEESVAIALDKTKNVHEAEKLIPALNGAVTEKAIRALIKNGSTQALKAIAFSHVEIKLAWNELNEKYDELVTSRHCSGMSKAQRDALLSMCGAGMPMLNAHFKTTYYAPPQTYYPNRERIEEEITCRSKGAYIVSLGELNDANQLNEVLEALWDKGINHMTLGEKHSRTQETAAKAILKILRDHNLTYSDKDKMARLQKLANPEERRRRY